MRYKNYEFLIIVVIITFYSCANNKTKTVGIGNLEPVQKWFDAWELISNNFISSIILP